MDQDSKIQSPQTNFWKELFKLILLAVIVVIPFRYFIAQPFVVDGLSMYPTFDNGEYLIIDELSYHFHTPERGSVLVFKYPKDTSKYFIKRVIGLPGETISIKDGVVSIINNDNPGGLVLDEPYVSTELEKKENYSYTLSQDEYFVMGDNRLQSSDSRVWGPVPSVDIIGRPIIRLIPPALLPGQVSYKEVKEVNNNNP